MNETRVDPNNDSIGPHLDDVCNLVYKHFGVIHSENIVNIDNEHDDNMVWLRSVQKFSSTPKSMSFSTPSSHRNRTHNNSYSTLRLPKDFSILPKVSDQFFTPMADQTFSTPKPFASPFIEKENNNGSTPRRIVRPGQKNTHTPLHPQPKTPIANPVNKKTPLQPRGQQQTPTPKPSVKRKTPSDSSSNTPAAGERHIKHDYATMDDPILRIGLQKEKDKLASQPNPKKPKVETESTKSTKKQKSKEGSLKKIPILNGSKGKKNKPKKHSKDQPPKLETGIPPAVRVPKPRESVDDNLDDLKRQAMELVVEDTLLPPARVEATQPPVQVPKPKAVPPIEHRQVNDGEVLREKLIELEKELDRMNKEEPIPPPNRKRSKSSSSDSEQPKQGHHKDRSKDIQPPVTNIFKYETVLPKPAAQAPQRVYDLTPYHSTDEETSEDEKRRKEKKKALIPSWAHTESLAQHLAHQRMTDPDEVFSHEFRESPNLGEIFSKLTDRAKAPRKSSGNWTQDKWTFVEKQEYNERMGYRSPALNGDANGNSKHRHPPQRKK